ncbi:MAG: hypothetical protein RIR73_1211 [Chloroflexota bacterium]|jgi:hypothetical protein
MGYASAEKDSNLGNQAKVGGEKREHVCMLNPFADGDPVEQHPLVVGSNLFGNPFANIFK